MSFLRLSYKEEFGDFDLDVENGRFVASDDFQAAVFDSLFTDRRASDDELKRWGFTPDQNRGWWGENYPIVPGDLEGSLLWLLRKAKKTDAALNAAVDFAEDALKWMRTDQVALSVTASASWRANSDVLVLVIDIVKADGERWVRAWNAINGAPLPAAA